MDRDIDIGNGFEDPTLAPGDRRLPVYLLLDVSTSMEGDKIVSLRNAYDYFITETTSDDQVASVAHVGVITFSTHAEMITDGLVKVFELPDSSNFHPEGVTRLDLALQKVLESFENDLKKPVKHGTKGDWRPVIYILTDGDPTDSEGYFPTDNWVADRDTLIDRPRGKFKPASMAVLGMGVNANVDKIKPIVTGSGLKFYTEFEPGDTAQFKDVIAYAFNFGDSAAGFRQAFRWINQSLSNSLDNLNVSGGESTGVLQDIP